ncbi:hypothetical protein GSI_08867 [Ganoderma sinense ZZ0214-1]|uniref:Uncharacterized protein n=1 Tax=Ganoderma sinense ZZ0214-1 TaxID=1077348 RepID=A0A2G8S4X6_9APHY|nr:hypothetical protein GSI_08867 [Ganoderma sinense ZZ0214-1]
MLNELKLNHVVLQPPHIQLTFDALQVSMPQPVPADADPRLFWNGQYLLEEDPDHPANLSEAAQEAQEAKWLALMKNRGPLKKLPRKMVPKDGSKPPLYHYGIPFTDRYMFEYAKRHGLTLELSPETSEYFDGSPVLDFSKLTPEQEQDADLMNQLLMIASLLAQCDMEKRQCGMKLHVARPFSSEWNGMVSLWSNYDWHDRYSKEVGSCARFQNIVAKLKEAMYEGGQENDIEWWYEWDNPVGLFSSLE